MASRRLLKKSINNLTFDLISECYVFSFFHRDTKPEKITGVMEEIVQLRNDMITKINNPIHKEDSKNNREFFKEIIVDMQKMVDIMDKLASKKE